jgi:hypothetical protein
MGHCAVSGTSDAGSSALDKQTYASLCGFALPLVEKPDVENDWLIHRVSLGK